ncbi:hypothetical protein RIF29_26195 [Crotalaria pallida]|uniref:Uncharacterized protein n=1 Tax=Crotalaria pallida TaxID=3830 RepID=A0AAN9EN27_CROPI
MDSENVENGIKMRRRRRSDVGHGVQADEGNLSKSISSYRIRRTVLKDVTNIAEDSSVAEQGYETMKNVKDNFEGSGVDQRSECIVECGEGSSNPRKRRRSLKSERDGVSLQLQNVEKLGGGPCSNRRKRRESGQKGKKRDLENYGLHK